MGENDEARAEWIQEYRDWLGTVREMRERIMAGLAEFLANRNRCSDRDEAEDR